MRHSYERIRQTISDLGYPAYRYKQLLESVFKRRIGLFSEMDMLPRNLRAALVRQYSDSICALHPVAQRTGMQVSKALFALPDGERIESVALRYKRGWESFCISSQCGCGFGCRFCATGTIGLRRNLTAKEITDQPLHFYLSGHELDSVSFMGMGEPLANPYIFEAIKLLTSPNHFGLSQRKITLSTVGIVPGIWRMTREFPQVNLAFSLHSPFDDERSELMPINRKHPLREVMGAINDHVMTTRRKVFIAYILLGGVNDTATHAQAVAKLIKAQSAHPHLYHVDLIPYNASDKTPREFRTPSHASTKVFHDVLKSRGISVSTRAQFGADIDAACGQLYGDQAR